MEIKEGDRVVLKNGMTGTVENINDFRESTMKYGITILGLNDITFVGEEQIEKKIVCEEPQYNIETDKCGNLVFQTNSEEYLEMFNRAIKNIEASLKDLKELKNVNIDIGKGKDVQTEETIMYSPEGNIIKREVKIVNGNEQRINEALDLIERLEPTEEIFEIEQILKGKNEHIPRID